MTSTDSANPSSPSLTVLRGFAGLTALLAIVQAALGVVVLVTDSDIVQVHRIIGMATAAVALVAAGAAAVWFRQSHNGGLLGHAVAVAVLAVVQVGLGEAGVVSVHIAVGVLVLGAAVDLARLTARKPGG